MKKRNSLIVIVTGVALILGFHFARELLGKREERRVRALIAAACDALAREDADAIIRMLDDDFVLERERDERLGRDRIEGVLNGAFNSFGGVNVRLQRPVRIEALKTYATARLHTRTTSPVHPGRPVDEYWRMEFRKTDGRWFFSRVQRIEQDLY